MTATNADVLAPPKGGRRKAERRWKPKSGECLYCGKWYVGLHQHQRLLHPKENLT